jgi:site-specific DNA-cytosine methylase
MVYVSNPKAASTTIHRIFLALSGIEPGMPTRKAYRNPAIRERINRSGLRQEEIDPKSQASGPYSDYFWFTFVRDPYSRAVSNYNNKLNRYALNFDRRAYFAAKVAQFFGGPSAWRSHLYGVRYLQKRISFKAYVRGLHRYGVGFDPHFRVQRRILQTGIVRYDYIGRVERFEKDIRKVLKANGIADEALIASAMKTRENTSSAERPVEELLTGRLRQRIHDLYVDDFRAFGYRRSERRRRAGARRKRQAGARQAAQ